VLFEKHLKFLSSEPNWFDRDRFILSAGHGSMLLYSVLYLAGYPDITLEDIKNFRQLNSKTAGHPEYGHVPGIETTTGPLGQGLGNAVGMAIAEEFIGTRWGSDLCDHYTYVIAGDGCLMEGISQEVISLAGKLKLKKLIVIWDDNGITIDGGVDISCNTDQIARFKSSGWSTFSCDAHNPIEIDQAINSAKKDNRPSLIAAKSIIGYGSTAKQGTSGAHGAPLGKSEVEQLRKNFDWQYKEFLIPSNIKESWAKIGQKNHKVFKDWSNRFQSLSEKKRISFLNELDQIFPSKLTRGIKDFKKLHSQEVKTELATRKASELCLDLINECFNNTIGGSADLTGSNNTKTKKLEVFSEHNRSGRYIHYGIREHGMAAIMNGMFLHGGIIPYGGTFLTFSDYCRGAIRLSALMGLGVIYIMTHDSIGLGEDGPTHQPVEHLASLRSIPNLNVFRPCDIIETIECWEIALKSKYKPSIICLSRQNLPLIRKEKVSINRSFKGAYIIKDFINKKKVILIATGSEVQIALKAGEVLENNGIGTRVISLPSWELFEEQDYEYKKKLLPRGTVRIAVEAGVKLGWEKWLYENSGSQTRTSFIGMKGFGASAPARDLFDHFQINVDEICRQAKLLI
ncbi:transketolase, partial [Paracoccaceae bacterium]|nr:transketolase [Paracoccaceae bacterium]